MLPFIFHVSKLYSPICCGEWNEGPFYHVSFATKCKNNYYSLKFLSLSDDLLKYFTHLKNRKRAINSKERKCFLRKKGSQTWILKTRTLLFYSRRVTKCSRLGHGTLKFIRIQSLEIASLKYSSLNKKRNHILAGCLPESLPSHRLKSLMVHSRRTLSCMLE